MPRDFTQPNPTPFRAQRQFTDREEFQEAFWKRINALDPKQQSVLYFYGVGGIGKSALLGELRRQLRDLPHMISRPTPHKKASWGWVDFQVPEYRHAPNALLQLRETLAERGNISLPTFDLAYAHYHLRFYHEELPKGLRDIAGRLDTGEVTKDTLSTIVEEIPVLSFIYKAGNIFSKAADARQEKLQIQQNRELRLFLLEQDPLKMTGRLVDFFAADLRAAHLPDRPIILFLDTFEALSVSGTTEYAGARPESWIEQLAGALPGILMVIAGRRALDWAKRDADWEQRDLLETHLVGDLAPEDARQFLTTAGLPDKFIPAVLDNFHGLPFYLDLIIDLYEQGVIKNDSDPAPEVFAGSMAQVIDRFLSYLTPAEQAAVRVLSAPSSFNYDRFKLLMNEFGTAYPQDRDSYQRLLNYSLFLTEGETSHVHEVARDFLGGETQKSVREYIVSSIEKQLSPATIPEFDVRLQLQIEEGFEQVLWLRGDLEAVKWLETHNSIFENSGRVGLLQDLLDRALSIRKSVLGEDHPNTITSNNNLANCLESLGRAQEALLIYQKTLEQRQEVLGDNHPHTITSSNNLAYCLQALGRAQEALPIYQKTLEQYQEVHGDDHPHTITSNNNLANCLESLGRAQEALPIYQKTLEQRQKVLGDDHPETITSNNNLAYCLENLGRAQEALPIYQKTLEQRQKVLGDNHPDTITSNNNLAYCLKSLGWAKEALPIYQKALEQRQKVLGDNHPDTITSNNNLAYCLKSLGRAQEALPIYQKALEQRQKVLGDDHPNTISSNNNLASCLESLGRAQEALPIYQKALEQCQKVLGDDHPNTIITNNNLASCLQALGRAKEALPIYQKALEQRQKVLGDNHPDTISSSNNLASCLQTLGRAKEALPIYQKALEQRQKVLGDDHPHTISSSNNLAYCLQTLGRAKEALPIYQKALEQRQKVLGDNHPDTITSNNNLAYCLYKLGRDDEALPYYEKVFQLRRKVFGGDNPSAITSLNNLASCLNDLGRLEEALPLFEKVLEQRRIVLGEDHPHTIKSLEKLQSCLQKLGRDE